MILNVRGCSNKLGIIISYLVENEEKNGYKSFNAKKIIVKNKVDMLTAIKKTLKSSRKLPEINASVFVSTISAVGKKNIIDTSLKTIVKSINDENMQPTMLTLSHVYFNNKPLPQIKAINIINNNMYFMIKVGSNYTLEPIKNERIKCMIVTNSLVNLYRRIKQGESFSKINFKKYHIPKVRPTNGVIRNAYRSYNESIDESPTREERVIEITAESGHLFTAIPTSNNTAWCSSSLDIPRTERERAEQRDRITETLYTEIDEAEERPIDTENTVTESSDTDEEERPIERQAEERQAVVAEESFTLIETPQPTTVNDEDEEDEEDRQVLAEREAEEERREEAEEERRDQLETDENLSMLYEEVPVIRDLPIIEREMVGISIAETERRHEGLIIRQPETNSTNTIRMSETLAERLASEVEVDESDEEAPAIRQVVTGSMRRAMQRQTEEGRRMNTEYRYSFT